MQIFIKLLHNIYSNYDKLSASTKSFNFLILQQQNLNALLNNDEQTLKHEKLIKYSQTSVVLSAGITSVESARQV